ncbi:MAG: MgtC/SapB family protein [Gemmatimonadota bacterium]
MDWLPAAPAWLELLELPTLGRLALALLLGAGIGLERELSEKPAGLRTNILICVGAELLTEMSLLVAADFGGRDLIPADPARITAQIVSGIGFIGAGTIIVLRGNVVGLTTAATLWVVAAIGITVGLHAYVEAIGATLLVLIVLVVLGKLERWIEEPERSTLRVVVAADPREAAPVSEVLSRTEYRVRRVAFVREGAVNALTYQVTGKPEKQDELIRLLEGLEAVRSARIE